jgi:hypothetical protein
VAAGDWPDIDDEDGEPDCIGEEWREEMEAVDVVDEGGEDAEVGIWLMFPV